MDKRKKRGRWIWLLVILAVLVAGIILVMNNVARQAQAVAAALTSQEQTHTVARGTLEKTITASGMLSAADEQLIKLPDGLLVEEVLVTAGEAVAAGQPLARLNADSVGEQLAYLAKKVAEEDVRLATPGNNDSIKSPSKGRVKYLPVEEGDDVFAAMQEFGVLAILSTDGWMRLSIETGRTLELGSRMEVCWDGGKAKGTVDRKTATGYRILVPDNHAPYLGAAALMDGDTEIGSGTLTINLPVEVVGYDGVIRTIRYKLDESVPDGREMFALKTPSVSTAFASRYAARGKLMDLYKRVIDLSADAYVNAPCDGVIGEISIKAGNPTGKTANADVENTAFTLGTGGATRLTVNIDELDIMAVVLGQTATISLDSMPNEPLTGEVTRISVSGKKENSISTFPVELTLPHNARLMAGMNGTATILVDRAENVLVVPIAAISEDAEGEYVLVRAADGGKARKPVKTGRSNSSMAEVTEGLREGDVVSYTASAMDLGDTGYGGGSFAMAVG